MSLMAARPTQRWFLRDCRRFNFWFYKISLVGKIYSLELSNFKAIHFNVKGRIVDMRHVFSRQHSIGYGVIPKSKHLVHYKFTPTYYQQYLTTKWGSTNIRISYYSDPYYHSHFWQSNTTQRVLQKYRWIHVIYYLFASNFYNIDYQILLEHDLYLNIFTWLNKFTSKRFVTFKRWLKYDFPLRKSYFDRRRSDFFLNLENKFIFKSYTIKNRRETGKLKYQKKIIENLVKKKQYKILKKPLLLVNTFQPNKGYTARKWKKYLNKKYWPLLKIKLKYKKGFSKILKYHSKRRTKLNVYKTNYWFLTNLFYSLTGAGIMKAKLKNFKH
jgi:hypothetical protein